MDRDGPGWPCVGPDASGQRFCAGLSHVGRIVYTTCLNKHQSHMYMKESIILCWCCKIVYIRDLHSSPCNTCAKSQWFAFIPSWEGTTTRWVLLIYLPCPSTTSTITSLRSTWCRCLQIPSSQTLGSKKNHGIMGDHGYPNEKSWKITHDDVGSPIAIHCQHPPHGASGIPCSAFRTAAGLTEMARARWLVGLGKPSLAGREKFRKCMWNIVKA
jgi:hypothetical protein